MKKLLQLFYNTPLAVQPHMIPIIRNVLERWAAGVKLSDQEIEAAVGDAPEAAAARRNRPAPRGIGVIPLIGILAQRRAGSVSTAGTATDTVLRAFKGMMADSQVDVIVLDIDSPGGSVFGVMELAAEIYAARGKKKVVAVANSLAASAAYWIGTAADELVVTPGGGVGSVGVVAAHEDHSKRLEAEGVDVSLIYAGKHKVEGNMFRPLDDEARAQLQADVDMYYSEFVSAVARHRSVSAADVRNGFGEGRVLPAKQAVAENMADRVETFDQTIERLLTAPRALAPKRRASTARADLDLKEQECRAALDR